MLTNAGHVCEISCTIPSYVVPGANARCPVSVYLCNVQNYVFKMGQLFHRIPKYKREFRFGDLDYTGCCEIKGEYFTSVFYG